MKADAPVAEDLPESPRDWERRVSQKDNHDSALKSHQRLRLTVAYDGAAFLGWQTQTQTPTAQAVLEKALAKIFPTAPPIVGSSRTDTGVHARGMVLHFDAPRAAWRLPMRKLILAINDHLPPELRVMAAARARPDFHARFQSSGKEYRYHIWNHAALDPWYRRTAWHVPRALDVAAMRAAAKSLVGKHNFRSFAANPGYERASYVRTLSRCEVRRRGSLITLVFQADGFLYKMCRGLTGTLVQVGLGKFAPTEITSMIAQGDRRVAGMTAPAQGLVLWRVLYPSLRVSASSRAPSSSA